MAISPELAFSTPATMLKSVLFPQPLGPITETNSPAATVKSIDAITSREHRPSRNTLLTPCTSSFGVSISLTSTHARSEHAKGRNPDVEDCGLHAYEKLGARLPLPSAGITQIRFIGSAVRPLRLPLSQSTPLAAICCSILVPARGISTFSRAYVNVLNIYLT